MKTAMKDLEGKADLELLVNTFYDKVLAEPSIGPVFNTIIGDRWPQHIAVLVSFWDFVIFSEPGYSGSPLKRHIEMNRQAPLRKEHFDIWLDLWYDTVDDLFEGETATRTKNHAKMISNLIANQMEWARMDQ